MPEIPREYLAEETAKMERKKKVRETEAYVRERLAAEVSPERKEALGRELAATADFFADAGIDFYVAGGTGIDLLDGEWNRDHQDLDAAIPGSDRRKFFEAATRGGYRINGSDGKALTAEQVDDRRTHNAFVSGGGPDGASRFEVIFLNETPTGDLELAAGVTVPRAHYDDAPSADVGEKKVKIQPPEVILFHKLIDGRRKDFRDAAKVWESLSTERKARLEGYLRDAGAAFTVGGKEVSDIPTLFALGGEQDELKHDAFFENSVDAMEKELQKEIAERSAEIFEMRRSAADRAAFVEAVIARYDGNAPERRPVIDAMAEHLYASEPRLEEFTAWARGAMNVDAGIRDRALHGYVSENLWETKLGND